MATTARFEATRPRGIRALGVIHPCARCGIEREARIESLCRDCNSILTVTERKAWAA